MQNRTPINGMNDAPPMAYARHPTDCFAGGGADDVSVVMCVVG
jgi:hypothetical protein